MAITAGINGRLSLGYDETPLTITKTPCSGASPYTVYQIEDEDYRFLDPSTAASVYVNDVLVTSGYTVYYSGGIIVFDTALQALDEVTISGKYIALTEIATAKSLSLDITWTSEDVSTFDTSVKDQQGWGANALTMKQLTGTVEALLDADVDEWHDAMLGDDTQDGGAVLAIQYMHPDEWVVYLYGYVTGVSMASSASGIATETISFTLMGTPPYFKAL